MGAFGRGRYPRKDDVESRAVGPDHSMPMVTLSAQESARVGRGLAWSWCSRRNFSASHFFNRLDHSIDIGSPADAANVIPALVALRQAIIARWPALSEK